jgi:hypothetical protein
MGMGAWLVAIEWRGKELLDGVYFFFFSSHIFDWSGGGLGLGGSEYIYIYTQIVEEKKVGKV